MLHRHDAGQWFHLDFKINTNLFRNCYRYMYVCYLHNEKSYLLGWTTRLKLLQGTPYSTYHILVKLRRLGSITWNKYPNHELIVLSRLPAGCRNYLRVILSKINVNRQEIWQIRFINWGLLKLPYSNNLSESSQDTVHWREFRSRSEWSRSRKPWTLEVHSQKLEGVSLEKLLLYHGCVYITLTTPGFLF